MKLKTMLAASAAALLTTAAQANTPEQLVQAANAALAAEGKNYVIEMAETLTSLDNGETAGQVTFFNNRGNKQLTADFVPGDPRRAAWSAGTNITFALDAVNLTPDIASELSEIRAAMGTWENVQCSNIQLADRGDFGDYGVVQFLVGYGGVPGVAGDVGHAGFLPAGFFDAIGGPGGGTGILGVTFTFVFIDGAGDPTDVDGNGLADVAFREIYYNDGFLWETDPADQPGDGRFDLQTVALHEAGHGLSQAHFGALKQTNNGKLHFAPLAVMNAGYVFGQQALAGTDRGGHCSNWASWPNN